MIVFNLIVPLVTSLTSSSKVMFSLLLRVAVCGYITHLSHEMWPWGVTLAWKKGYNRRPSMHTVQTHMLIHTRTF